jgi:transcriptional regulator GlxA family with amidase domain
VRIEILLYDGFDELDAVGPWEVLQRARQSGAPFEVALASLGEKRLITAAHGLRVQAEQVLAAGGRPDTLVVPGGGWNDRSPQGAWTETRREEIPRAISRLHGSGSTIAAVCTGAMLVAASGLFKNRPATTHHAAIDDLRSYGARIIEARVVDAGDLISSGAVTSGIDLALWLVERFASETAAQDIAAAIEYPRQGVVWRAAGEARRGTHEIQGSH